MKSTRRSIGNENILNVEKYLHGMLPMVVPREDFVASLRQRLMDMPVKKHWLPTVLFFVLVTLAGLVSGLILIATSLRALVAIAAALSLIYKMRFTPKGNTTPATQPGG